MNYERWSFGYWCLKQYVCFANRSIHDEIILIGKENIPTNRPILFAPNHQNALSDPMTILSHTCFQPGWLARADIFKPSIITYFLRFLKIMPVNRLRDALEKAIETLIFNIYSKTNYNGFELIRALYDKAHAKKIEKQQILNQQEELFSELKKIT